MVEDQRVEGVTPSGPGSQASPEAVPSSPSVSIPNAEDDLSTKTPQQIGAMISALSVVIELYSKNVREAEQRYQKDREFLAMLMADFIRLTHYVARNAADSLETAPATVQSRSDT